MRSFLGPCRSQLQWSVLEDLMRRGAPMPPPAGPEAMVWCSTDSSARLTSTRCIKAGLPPMQRVVFRVRPSAQGQLGPFSPPSASIWTSPPDFAVSAVQSRLDGSGDEPPDRQHLERARDEAVARLRAQEAARDTLEQQLRQGVEAREKLEAKLKLELEAARRQADGLGDELGTARAELAAGRRQCTAAEARSEEASERLGALKEELVAERRRSESLRHGQEVLKEELKVARRRHDVLMAKRGELEAELQRAGNLATKVAELQVELHRERERALNALGEAKGAPVDLR